MSATTEVNDKFKLGTTQGDDAVNGNCGNGRGDLYDVCYVFSGMGADGGDLRMKLQSEVGQNLPGQQSLNIFGWVEKGGTEVATRADGWKATALPLGTKVRVTVKSNSFANEVGWLVTSFKNPLLRISSGSDGVKRVIMSGATDITWGMKQGEDSPKFCERGDTTAGTIAQDFELVQTHTPSPQKNLRARPLGV